MSDQPERNEKPLSVSGAESSEGRKVVSEKTDAAPKFEKGPRFWAIIATLCVVGLLSSLENTVVTTSLPFIVTQLGLGENYIWVTNIFFLTSTVVQPFFGQLANIFGRRYVCLAVIALFTLGSGIAGGARNGATLIAGRAVQGMGSGGINMIVDVIVSDLVPLRERGNYMAIILIVYFVGTAIGPYVGGAIVESTSWRWIGGVCMIMILLFLQVKYNKEMTFAQKMRRIDYLGNILLVAATVSVLFAMSYGGTRYPWSSWRVILPLVLGLLGLGVLPLVETSKFVKEPVVPPRLFANRTSATVFAITFLNSALLYWMLFFLPVYFQAVLGSSPARAGVQLLPSITIAIPFAIVAVVLLTKFGKYKPLHFFGFALNTIGLGLASLLDEKSSAAEWVMYQVIAAGGSGFVLNTLLPACQTPLQESDQAAATATWSFVRSFGSIWGVAIPAAIFNNYFDKLSTRISDQEVAAHFRNGKAYESASANLIDSFPEPVKQELVGVYVESLKYVWRMSVIFAGICFLLVFLEKQIKMRTELDTEFGLEDKKEKKKDPESGEKAMTEETDKVPAEETITEQP
ncbi:related to putative multidrug transporter Mfs1.1 (major facilitator family protein) [Cephalotrichum gorgonifer]|uniref:Related to putative multidrug transporter Mfs1.1 (Major facilitator family protein) n=1 Tax=Cephalotrichum gorgonifer TaxID=2041049 RepID=A0AAE8MWM8_9PEZI|nr:related to putative multidrug transporter Mfs1.1 (major facilitator family protein) [Cephalotrichum gorgonifer]